MDYIFKGIGFGLVYVPAIVAVGYYFDEKRSLAMGIAVCGTGLGNDKVNILCIFNLTLIFFKVLLS